MTKIFRILIPFFLFSIHYHRVSAQQLSIPEVHFVKISNYFSGNNSELLLNDSIKKNKNWIIRKVGYESLINIDSSDYRFEVNPLIDIQLSKDKDGNYYTNSRGFFVKGSIGKHLSFNSFYCETQSTFPVYLKDEITLMKVVPGEGIAKAFKETGYDYSWACGTVNYQSKYLDVSLGNGKNFIGSGYRSLFLSDAAFNNPFLKYKVKYKKWELQIMNLVLTDLKFPLDFEGGYTKKYALYRSLTYNFSENLKLGFIEADIPDQISGHHFLSDVNVMYIPLNPVIGSSLITNAFKGRNNTLSGLDLFWKPVQSLVIYSQCVVDDLNFDSKNVLWGGQLGFVASLLQKENHSVRLWGEVNMVKPFAFSSSESITSYTHYYQPLAHPSGANFLELIGGVDFQRRRILASFTGNVIIQGNNTIADNYGANPLSSNDNAATIISDKKYSFLMGEKQVMLNQDLHLSYVINPAYNLILDLGMAARITVSGDDKNLYYLPYFALRTYLFNRNYNF